MTDSRITDEGGFLAAACAEARSLKKDSEELQTLRAFRDGWLRNTEGGADAIAHYEEVSPKIIAAIRRLTDAETTWNEIYDSAVQPCVALIRANRNEAAYELYRRAALDLEKLCRLTEEDRNAVV